MTLGPGDVKKTVEEAEKLASKLAKLGQARIRFDLHPHPCDKDFKEHEPHADVFVVPWDSPDPPKDCDEHQVGRHYKGTIPNQRYFSVDVDPIGGKAKRALSYLWVPWGQEKRLVSPKHRRRKSVLVILKPIGPWARL